MTAGPREPASTTTIRIGKTTKKRLENTGTMGDSFDTVINKLLDEHEKMQSSKKK